MPTTLPTVRGADIRDNYADFFRRVRMDVTFTIDEIVVASATLAYAMTRSQGKQTVLARGTASPELNREIYILRNEDGAWKFARYMFNKPE
jgi:ketosteroid isomerase-like protein